MAKKEKQEKPQTDEIGEKLREDPRFLATVLDGAQKRLVQVLREKEGVNNALAEIDNTINSLEFLEKDKKERTALIPLKSGVLAEGKITNSKQVLVDVGQGVVLRKDTKNALETMRNRKKVLLDVLGRLEKERLDLANFGRTVDEHFKKDIVPKGLGRNE